MNNKNEVLNVLTNINQTINQYISSKSIHSFLFIIFSFIIFEKYELYSLGLIFYLFTIYYFFNNYIQFEKSNLTIDSEYNKMQLFYIIKGFFLLLFFTILLDYKFQLPNFRIFFTSFLTLTLLLFVPYYYIKFEFEKGNNFGFFVKQLLFIHSISFIILVFLTSIIMDKYPFIANSSNYSLLAFLVFNILLTFLFNLYLYFSPISKIKYVETSVLFLSSLFLTSSIFSFLLIYFLGNTLKDFFSSIPSGELLMGLELIFNLIYIPLILPFIWAPFTLKLKKIRN